MFIKFKCFVYCIVATIGGYVLSRLLHADTVNLNEILIVGGLLGLICATSIALFCKERYHVLVGIASTTTVWLAFVTSMADQFGTSGFDSSKIIVTTALVAMLGAVGALGYKLGLP